MVRGMALGPIAGRIAPCGEYSYVGANCEALKSYENKPFIEKMVGTW